jgi:hypothetical protein
MEYIHSCKVPIQKAIWYFKMNQLAHSSQLGEKNKQKKSSAVEQFSSGKLMTR